MSWPPERCVNHGCYWCHVKQYLFALFWTVCHRRVCTSEILVGEEKLRVVHCWLQHPFTLKIMVLCEEWEWQAFAENRNGSVCQPAVPNAAKLSKGVEYKQHFVTECQSSMYTRVAPFCFYVVSAVDVPQDSKIRWSDVKLLFCFVFKQSLHRFFFSRRGFEGRLLVTFCVSYFSIAVIGQYRRVSGGLQFQRQTGMGMER